MLVPVAAWFEENRIDCDEAKIGEDLAHALRRHGNGYVMAKFLEYSAGWTDIDADLVAILDGGRNTLSAVLDGAIRDWVKQTNLQPAHKIGDRVKHRGRNGRIIRINAEEGIYDFLNEDHEGKPRSHMWADHIPLEEIDGLQDD
jgi:hypothetical protein